MEECFWSKRLGEWYFQYTKSFHFQILHNRSGGAKTWIKLRIRMKVSYCGWKGWKRYILPVKTDTQNCLNRSVVLWLCRMFS